MPSTFIPLEAPGDYSCSVNPSTPDSPGGTITVCAKIVKADLTKMPGGANNVHVANVTLKVRPRVTPKLVA